MLREAFAEALRRDPEKKRRWVVLVDGEPKQLRAVKAEARETLRFEAAPAPTRAELEGIHRRVMKWLCRRGLLRGPRHRLA